MSDTQYTGYSGTQSGYSNYGNYTSDSSYPQSGYPQTNTGYSATGWSGNASAGSNYSGYGQEQYNQPAPTYNYGQQQQQQPPPPQPQSPNYNQGGSGNYGDHGRGGYGNQGPGRGGFNKGGRGNYHPNGGSGYDGGEEIQDTIFVSGLPEEVSEQQLSEFFGSIGVIKNDKRTGKQKIWIYKDKITGKGKGEATVTYDDPPTATSAISWFNGKDFQGKNITVQLAQRKAQNFGMGGGGGNMSGRDGDWKCPHPNCGNTNFSWRMSCNRCQAPRDGNAGGMESGGEQRSSRGGGHRGGMRGEGGGRGGRGGRGRGGGGMGGRGFGRGGGRGGGPMRGGGGGGGQGGERRPRPY